MMSSEEKLNRLILAAMFLALALVLPFLTGQIKQLGNAFCPMHFPVLLCGFFCGPWYGLLVGFVSPLLRFVMFGMPPVIPIGLAMCFELATYGLISGLLYSALPKKKVSVYAALIGAMIAGRIVWGIASAVIYGVTGAEFGMKMFITGSVLSAVPGIIIQIIAIPIIVMALNKQKVDG